MKLYHSAASPFVRRVMIVAHEHGLADQITCVRSKVTMTVPNMDVMRDNPLGKVPVLILDDGTALYDSDVICAYLDEVSGNLPLVPISGANKWQHLTWASLGAGLADVLLLLFREYLRPTEMQMPELIAIFELKIKASFKHLSREVKDLENADFSIAHIAICCALDYCDMRFAGIEWRQSYPELARWADTVLARPSFKLTDARLQQAA